MSNKKIIEVLKTHVEIGRGWLKTADKNTNKERLIGLIQGYEFAVKLLKGEH